ncbi:activator of Hsp90 ATPase, putative [Plasmodium knowlesi strain H]|uniref:Activator of Hsp90 ATPase, putative n=3 Tax=Plasmodium knowlesi TaxID=5850 RepID=A0A5K1V3E5_PLAKH|nr:activator of Hsp90 ATPase, putative [Plasmodium knowlesi strain H]OTN65924.1 putative Activator of Hsp90 ATPase [Plasmodium knowlesi]CAA9988003.1 activator of Hsp90 ATPase, putative [Plasmodium knowlesi strain H]SBO22051.1 activator of Hsp90 ATPase, putative [Plasmodium knowlesi strain H]SBO29140.1 activator of Hsp90 ATPase, putative [Plasmodium knowlesi strain H]VVS77477.1 activator of Hsp90 ATPase, putative [Plasmodium knowlesi strain H]|eukprot:XP_002258982.1 hypothetical protein, conserved in Plasmodium species [Plasmodium knowlesi strain H]
MAGSVWNRNSWHWEEKNYNKWGESYIKNKLSDLKIEKEDLSVYFDRVDISGNASVSIRKGKQINSFEYVIKFDWVCSKTGQDKEYAGGTAEILDFSNCSVEDNDYAINIELIGDKEESKRAYEILRKEGKEKIKDALKNFPEDLLKHDSNESNKEQKILAEEEEKLQKAKLQSAQQNQPEGVTTNIANNANHVKEENKEEGKKEGSIWNINNYHWEEKCLTKWAQEELKNMLDTSTIQLSNNISLQLFSSEVDGEASSSLRKKKKIIIYDLKINTEWKAFKKNKNGQVEMEITGHVIVNDVISDFSSQEDSKYTFQFIFDNARPEAADMNEVIKNEGPAHIEKIIEAFISKMMEK